METFHHVPMPIFTIIYCTDQIHNVIHIMDKSWLLGWTWAIIPVWVSCWISTNRTGDWARWKYMRICNVWVPDYAWEEKKIFTSYIAITNIGSRQIYNYSFVLHVNIKKRLLVTYGLCITLTASEMSQALNVIFTFKSFQQLTDILLSMNWDSTRSRMDVAQDEY